MSCTCAKKVQASEVVDLLDLVTFAGTHRFISVHNKCCTLHCCGYYVWYSWRSIGDFRMPEMQL
jgi:hypothetical protein